MYRIITIEVNSCCLSYLLKGGTRSCVNNKKKDIDLKLNTGLFLFYLQKGKNVTI